MVLLFSRDPDGGLFISHPKDKPIKIDGKWDFGGCANFLYIPKEAIDPLPIEPGQQTELALFYQMAMVGKNMDVAL